MEITIEITKNKSLCCKAPIHIEHKKDGVRESTMPFCSKCGKFPPTSLAALKKAKNYLETQS